MIESDPRLIKAAKAFEGKEYVYGFYEGRLYIALLLWCCIDWDQANAEADRVGGYLATLTSAAENRFVLDLFRHDERMWEVGANGRWFDGPAFGFVQQVGAREPNGGWGWVTNEPVSFNQWFPGSPHNTGGKSFFATFGHFSQNHPKWNASFIGS